MQAVTGQPIKNFFFPNSPESLHPMSKKPEDSGYEIATEVEYFFLPRAVSHFEEKLSTEFMGLLK